MKSGNTISRIAAFFSARKPVNKFRNPVDTLPSRICDVIDPWVKDPWVKEHPDHPALVEASGSWTYLQLASAISEAQQWLVDLGVRPGDRVILVCENCRAAVAILLGAAALGAWSVVVG